MLAKFVNEDNNINWKQLGTYFCLYEAPKTYPTEDQGNYTDFKL